MALALVQMFACLSLWGHPSFWTAQALFVAPSLLVGGLTFFAKPTTLTLFRDCLVVDRAWRRPRVLHRTKNLLFFVRSRKDDRWVAAREALDDFSPRPRRDDFDLPPRLPGSPEKLAEDLNYWAAGVAPNEIRARLGVYEG